ncbi:MAG: hypothetical protein GXO32_03285 [Crenarchaeota archaeon]|nr:hypothetical protein [Thermoproteota archaeon]
MELRDVARILEGMGMRIELNEEIGSLSTWIDERARLDVYRSEDGAQGIICAYSELGSFCARIAVIRSERDIEKLVEVARRVSELTKMGFEVEDPSLYRPAFTEIVLGSIEDPRVKIVASERGFEILGEVLAPSTALRSIKEALARHGFEARTPRRGKVSLIEVRMETSAERAAEDAKSLVEALREIDLGDAWRKTDVAHRVVSAYIFAATRDRIDPYAPTYLGHVARWLGIEFVDGGSVAARLAMTGALWLSESGAELMGRDLVELIGKRYAGKMLVDAARCGAFAAKLADAAARSVEVLDTVEPYLRWNAPSDFVTKIAERSLAHQIPEIIARIKRLLVTEPAILATANRSLASRLIGTVYDDAVLIASAAHGSPDHPKLRCSTDRCRELVIGALAASPEGEIAFAVKIPGTGIAAPVIARSADEAAEKAARNIGTLRTYASIVTRLAGRFVLPLGSVIEVRKVQHRGEKLRLILVRALPGFAVPEGIARAMIGPGGKTILYDATDTRLVEIVAALARREAGREPRALAP